MKPRQPLPSSSTSPRRAVVYTRVSSGPQVEGTSLDSQFLACRTKAEEMGAQVIASCQDVESGASYRSRTGLQRALGLIERGEADTLVIYDMSRYSRDLEHQQQIARRVAAANGKLVFCTLDFGDPSDSPEANMAFGMNGVFAQYERLKFRERSMNGKLTRARSGVQPSRTLSPYGYTVVNTGHVMNGLHPKELLGKYLIKEEEAKIVFEIFQMYAQGKSLSAVAAELDSRGIAPPQKGKHWPSNTIHFIIENPVYRGEPNWGRSTQIQDESRIDRGLKPTVNKKRDRADWVPMEAPPIVDSALWEAANEKLKLNLPGSRKNCYLLRGLLICPGCGRPMSGTTIGGSAYYRRNEPGQPSRARYRCNANKTRDKVRRCEHTFHYRADLMEEAVLKLVVDMARHPANLRSYVEARREKKAASKGPAKRKQLEAQLATLRKRQETLIEAQLRAIEAGVSSVLYETKLRDTESEMEEISRELADIADPEDGNSVDNLIEEMRVLGEMVSDFYAEPRISTLDKNRSLASTLR